MSYYSETYLFWRSLIGNQIITSLTIGTPILLRSSISLYFPSRAVQGFGEVFQLNVPTNLNNIVLTGGIMKITTLSFESKKSSIFKPCLGWMCMFAKHNLSKYKKKNKNIKLLIDICKKLIKHILKIIVFVRVFYICISIMIFIF